MIACRLKCHEGDGEQVVVVLLFESAGAGSWEFSWLVWVLFFFFKL